MESEYTFEQLYETEDYFTELTKEQELTKEKIPEFNSHCKILCDCHRNLVEDNESAKVELQRAFEEKARRRNGTRIIMPLIKEISRDPGILDNYLNVTLSPNDFDGRRSKRVTQRWIETAKNVMESHNTYLELITQ